MGLRDKLKQSVKKTVQRFSGEYSAEAPDRIRPFERDLGEDQDREVVRARLNRPKTKE